MKENDLQELINVIGKIEKITGGHLGNWKYCLEQANTLWQKCPYQVNNRVMLIKTPVINEKESWGWLGSKHYLIEGSIATVKTREFYQGGFVFGLHFDDETWIDTSGKKNVPDTKSLYMFGENWLAPADYIALSCEAL